MTRKKQEFDPLAGPIGGGGLRKKKSKRKSFDVLGGGFGGEHTVEKESFDSYVEVSFGGSSDALMETGGGSYPASKQKKRGLFSSIFGGKKKEKKQVRERKQPLETEEEMPESYMPRHVRDPELMIHDGVMETEIVDRWDDFAYEYETDDAEGQEYEEPVQQHRAAAHHPPVKEDDLFEEDEGAAPQVCRPTERAAPAPVRTIAPPPSPSGRQAAASSATPDMHVCHLCGVRSPTELSQFSYGSGACVPLCRTCYRAVTTLIQYRDPEDEREIKSEWFTLCPNLDSDRSDAVIAEGRKNS